MSVLPHHDDYKSDTVTNLLARAGNWCLGKVIERRATVPPIQPRRVVHYEQLGPHSYRLLTDIEYYSLRYKKSVTVTAGKHSDGATGAMDIMSRGSWIHDELTDDPYWDDGTYCSRWASSMVLGDVLAEDGYWFRRWTWPIATFLANPFNR